MKTGKTWSLGVLIAFLMMLAGITIFIVIVDPFFHYHKPLEHLEYPIDNQRYQNDGILKHFEYDAVIIGTSMTANFKTSELNQLFDVNSVKVPFDGASYKEINENLERAIAANSDIKLIVRGLDYDRLLDEKDVMFYETDYYPTYLYDDSFFNDTKYWFNKSILWNNTWEVIRYTKDGKITPSFDQYSNWMPNWTFGKDAVDATYLREEKMDEIMGLSENDVKNIQENFTQNVTDLVAKNSNIEFYFFFTPYSIYYWDSLKQTGMLERQLQAEKKAIEILLQYDNIHLFSFSDEFDMISNLDNYKDIKHYGENVNSQMLVWMKEGKHQLTKENYQSYYNLIYKFYTTYDYDALFE